MHCKHINNSQFPFAAYHFHSMFKSLISKFLKVTTVFFHLSLYYPFGEYHTKKCLLFNNTIYLYNYNVKTF